MKDGLLIVVSGPSGTGKGTICKALLDTYKNINLSISATTRLPRNGEEDGKSYFFLTKEKFQNMIKENEFLEYAKVYDNYYGTPQKYVMEEIKKGNNVLLEIDIQGALQVKEKFSQGVFIFIIPPSMAELKKRITNRGTESEDSLKKRFKSAIDEIGYVRQYDYCIVNDEVEKAVDKIKAVILSEQSKVKNDIEEIIKKFEEELNC